jgi:hypothetical protein
MATGSPDFERREQALKVVRRGLRRIEIETHRVKAHLARLEADLEDDVANWLSRTLRHDKPAPCETRNDLPAAAGQAELSSSHSASNPSAAPPLLEQDAGLPIARISAAASSSPNGQTKSNHVSASVETHQPGPQIIITGGSSPDGGTSASGARRRLYRRAASPIVCSLVIHATGLLLCLTFGFATLVQQSVPLLASPADVTEEAPAEISEVKIESAKFEDAELQNVVSESEAFNLADNLLRTSEPTQIGAGSRPLGDVGQLDALPSELGTLMAGAGSPGSGPPGGALGDAVFFGTRSQGNRIVYVVDNSSSMKGGRFEAAIAELVRSVEALSPRQAFYVVFVSDQTYPMFYPQPATDLLPATPANKKRLAEWLPKALLASGKNRELIKAMDLAASLRPDAVYLLWDGDMRYSERVRLEVMTHLTRPNQWTFPIHTLGMGITSLDAEYNLTTIAQAHGGTYRRVDVPATSGR